MQSSCLVYRSQQHGGTDDGATTALHQHGGSPTKTTSHSRTSARLSRRHTSTPAQRHTCRIGGPFADTTAPWYGGTPTKPTSHKPTQHGYTTAYPHTHQHGGAPISIAIAVAHQQHGGTPTNTQHDGPQYPPARLHGDTTVHQHTSTPAQTRPHQHGATPTNTISTTSR